MFFFLFLHGIAFPYPESCGFVAWQAGDQYLSYRIEEVLTGVVSFSLTDLPDLGYSPSDFCLDGGDYCSEILASPIEPISVGGDVYWISSKSYYEGGWNSWVCASGKTYMFVKVRLSLASPPDSDGDGYDDQHDPFPNDPNCPGSATKVWESTSKLECGSCYIREWKDTTGECGSIIETNCPDEILNDPSAQCTINMWLVPTTKEYSEIADTGANIKVVDPDSPLASGGFSVVHMGGNSPENGVQDKPSAISGSGGSSGTASPDQVQDNDNKIIADYLAGIQQNQAGLAGQLQDTNSYLQGLMQQDLKNNESLDNLLAWLRQGEGSQLQPKTQDDYNSNIDLNQFGEAGQEKDIGGLLDSFVSNSPILSAITGSHVEIENQSCSFGGQIFGREISFNFCSGSVVQLLDMMGQFFVAICALAFFFIAFA